MDATHWCNVRELLSAARTAEKLSSRHPDTKQVRICPRLGRLTVIGQDIDARVATYVEMTSSELSAQGVEKSLEVEIDGPGFVNVLQAARTGPCRASRNDCIGIRFLDGKLRVLTKTNEAFSELTTNEVPECADPEVIPERAQCYSVHVDHLSRALQTVMFALPRRSDKKRKELQSVSFINRHVAGTDGKRIAFYSLPDVDGLKMIVPRPAIDALRRVLTRGSGVVTIAHDEEIGRVWFSVPAGVLRAAGMVTADLSGVNIPDYISYLPVERRFTVDVDVHHLRAAVAQAVEQGPTVAPKYQVVQLIADSRGVSVAALDNKWQSAPFGIVCHAENGDPYRVTFCAHYIIDAAKMLRRGVVTLMFGLDRSPVIMRQDAWSYAFIPKVVK